MTRPTIIDRVLGSVTTTDAATRARLRESRAVAAKVESLSVNKLAEQADYLQAQMSLLMDRYGDGFLPIGGYPGKVARVAGHNLPTVFNELHLDQYRNICRILYDSNDYAAGLIDRLVDYTAGRGFNWTAYRIGEKPASTLDDLPPELKTAQAALDQFKRRDHWRGRERELIRRGHRDGEAFIRMFRSRPGRPPAVRTTEPEWVSMPHGCQENGPFSFGILTHPDDVEKPLAYHVIDPNPGGTGEIVLAGGLLPEEEVEARELIEEYVPNIPVGPGRMYHYKCNVDRTTKRGMPTFAAAAAGYDSAAKLLRNVMDTSALQAAIYLIRKHTGATPGALTAFTGNFANSGTTIQPGARGSTGGITPRSVPTAAQGGSITIDTSENTNYEAGPVSNGIPIYLQGLQAQLRKGGCRVGAPEYLSSGDASNGNYASTKEAGSPFVVATEGRQQDLADFEEVLADDVLKFTVPMDGASFDGVCVSVQPPPVSIRSELEVDQQRAVQRQNKVLSATTWQKQAGLKPEVEQANFAKESELYPDDAPPMTIPDDGSSMG